MVLFEIFLCKKFDPNIHQNAPNCNIFKKISRGGMSPNPPNFQISKIIFLPPPPLPNPGDAPGIHPPRPHPQQSWECAC